VSNAFNIVDRVAIFDGLQRRGFSRFIPFLRQFYSEPSELLFQGVQSPAVLESARGVRQGDPMGPFLFCIAYQDVLEAGSAVIRDEQGLVVSYLDDSPVAAPLGTLGRAYCAMEAAAAARGWLFRPKKSALYRVPEGGEVPECLQQMHIT